MSAQTFIHGAEIQRDEMGFFQLEEGRRIDIPEATAERIILFREMGLSDETAESWLNAT